MSGFAGAWLAHAGAAALGLAAAGVVLGVALAGFRKRPVLGYRMAGLVLVGALVLPFVQALAARMALGDVLRAGAATVSAPADERGSDAREPAALGPQALVLLGAWLATADGPDAGAERPLDALPEPAAAGPAQARGQAGLPGLTGLAGLAGLARAPLARLRALAPWIAALHAAGAVACLARSLVRLARTRAVLRRSHAVSARNAPELVRLWRALAARSPVGSRVALRASAELASPACFGGRRPAVLLPACDVEAACDVVRLRCVLVHELVHLERNDSRAMLLQELFRALFWFHPVAWWLAREIDRLREVSCDWIAVRRTGRDRGRVKRYASALLDYAERAAARPGVACGAHGAALVGRPSSSSQLRRRIDMLIALEGRPGHPRSRTLLSLCALALCIAWGAQTAVAAVWAPQPASQPAPQPASDPLARTRVQVAPALEPAQAYAPLLQRGTLGPLGAREAQTPSAPALESLAQLGYVHGAEPAGTASQGSDAPTLGVSLEAVGEALAAHLGRDARSLLLIAAVVPGSLAERAGLERLDVLFEVDGEAASSASLARAKERLGAGQPIQLGVIRRGAIQRQQVGPFSAEVLEQGRTALGLHEGQHASEPLLRREARAPRTAEAERADAGWLRAQRPAELYEQALGYYERVDGERFRRDLASALKLYDELARSGELNEQSRAHQDHVRELVEGGRYQEYVDAMRTRLRSMSRQDFDEQIGRPLTELDPAVLGAIAERWRALARERTEQGAGPRADRARTADDLARSLAEAQEALRRQAQELERLRTELERLGRDGGAR